MLKIISTKLPHIVSGNIFTIVPVTQYVYLNDTLNFECATNFTKYHLLFITNECSGIKYSTLNAGGKMMSCSLTASSEINGTNVTCHATNEHDTTEVHMTEPAYMYVQG